MYDEQHFTRDAAVATFDDAADGITVDEHGDAQIDWEAVETVTVDDPPYQEAFDTDTFYKLPATVAKPIPQPYQYNDSTVWLKKPREELKRAAWSLDNRPWTMEHPDTGMVKDVDDVRGFWRDPEYIDERDDLNANMLVPTDDEEAKRFIEDHGDVSVGFYNRISPVDEYDGVVGGTDDESIDLDGYQTGMLFNHVASVETGRCPSGAGCGVDLDGAGATPSTDGHGHTAPVDVKPFKSGTRITDKNDEAGETTSVMAKSMDAPSGIHVADGQWFAVGPDEHPDDSTEYPDDAKFPVGSCENIKDAWNLRGTGDISIDESTLEERIKRAAEAKGCDMPDTAEMDAAAVAASAKQYSICGSRKDVMDDVDCGCADDNDDTDTFNMEIEFDDLSAEAALAKVSSQNDGVEERLDELREAEETASAAEDAVDELDLDSVEELADTASMLREQNEKLKDEIDELRRPKMEEDAAYIAEHTDRFGEDADAVMENLDEDAETISEKRDLVEDLTEKYDEATANSGGGEGETDSRDTGGYAKTPWE